MTTESVYAQEFPILEYDPTISAIIDIDLEQLAGINPRRNTGGTHCRID